MNLKEVDLECVGEPLGWMLETWAVLGIYLCPWIYFYIF